MSVLVGITPLVKENGEIVIEIKLKMFENLDNPERCSVITYLT